MYAQLKQIFYNYINSKAYQALGEMPEVMEAERRITDYAKNDVKGEYIRLEELVTAKAAACEMQGFVYGFRYAIQLMTVCIQPK